MKKIITFILLIIILSSAFCYFYYYKDIGLNKEYFIKKDLNNYMNLLISNNCSENKGTFLDKLCKNKMLQITGYDICALSLKNENAYITINTKITTINKDKGPENFNIPINIIMSKFDNIWNITISESLIERYFKNK
ncbi:MAG: hypothetical protein PHR68_04845 [Candidatus Gracilibacteria bacterium]|nr:hypothetical protein [Candidatus Gracilibacteria bacterium]